jgi:hypothetical protein
MFKLPLFFLLSGRVIAEAPTRVIYLFIVVTSFVAVYALRNTLVDVSMMYPWVRRN